MRKRIGVLLVCSLTFIFILRYSLQPSANLNKFVDLSSRRVEFILSLPVEERAFHLSEFSESPPSPLLTIEAPMPEFSKFNIDDFENVNKARSKKTPISSRRLPTRSGVKKAKTSDAISVDDYPEQKSSSTPIQAVPISKVVPHEALRGALDATTKSFEQSVRMVSEILKEHVDTIEVLKDKLDKREDDWNNLSQEIALLRVHEKQTKAENKRLFKEIQEINSKKKELEAALTKAKEELMLSVLKSVLETKIKLGKQVEAAGFKVPEWCITDWKEELLDLGDVTPVIQSVNKLQEVIEQVAEDVGDKITEEMAEDKAEEKDMDIVEDGGGEEEIVLMSDEGKNNQA